MVYIMYKDFENPLATMSMSEIAERISLKDPEAAKRWCQANEVLIHKFSKKSFVYQFDFEYAMGKPFVLALIRKQPNHWKTILQDVLKWNALYNYFLLNIGEDIESMPFEDIKILDGQQEKLLKRLLK
jgi:hypothetical protein